MIHRSPARLVGALLLLLTGCPADPPTTTPPTTTRPEEPDVPTSKGGSPVTSEQPPPTPTTTSTTKDRAQLLAMTPADVLKDGLRGSGTGGMSPLLAGEGAVAMAEQLREANVPLDALDLCVVVFDRARERTATGTIEAPARKELDAGVELQAGDLPSLHRWVKALAERAYQRQDLDAAVAFLMKVREIRALSQALTPPR